MTHWQNNNANEHNRVQHDLNNMRVNNIRLFEILNSWIENYYTTEWRSRTNWKYEKRKKWWDGINVNMAKELWEISQRTCFWMRRETAGTRSLREDLPASSLAAVATASCERCGTVWEWPAPTAGPQGRTAGQLPGQTRCWTRTDQSRPDSVESVGRWPDVIPWQHTPLWADLVQKYAKWQ